MAYPPQAAASKARPPSIGDCAGFMGSSGGGNWRAKVRDGIPATDTIDIRNAKGAAISHLTVRLARTPCELFSLLFCSGTIVSICFVIFYCFQFLSAFFIFPA